MHSLDSVARDALLEQDIDMNTTMTCRELIEFLDDYVADRLTPEARETFERHLGVCRHCRDYLRSYRETIVLARGAMDDKDADASTSMPEDLVRAVLMARRSAT